MTPDYLRPIGLRMYSQLIDKLDKLCAVNQRSRREILELLIERAHTEHKADKNTRITP